MTRFLLLLIGLCAAALTFGCSSQQPSAIAPAPKATASSQPRPSPLVMMQEEIAGIKQNPRLSPEEKAAFISHIKAGTLPGSPNWHPQGQGNASFGKQAAKQTASKNS